MTRSHNCHSAIKIFCIGKMCSAVPTSVQDINAVRWVGTRLEKWTFVSTILSLECLFLNAELIQFLEKNRVKLLQVLEPVDGSKNLVLDCSTTKENHSRLCHFQEWDHSEYREREEKAFRIQLHLTLHFLLVGKGSAQPLTKERKTKQRSPQRILETVVLPLCESNSALVGMKDLWPVNGVSFKHSSHTIRVIKNKGVLVAREESHPLVSLLNYLINLEDPSTIDLGAIVEGRGSGVSSGVVYTPKMVVSLFVDQLLIDWVKTKFGKEIHSLQDLCKLNQLTKERLLDKKTGLAVLKVLDPAVGSGIFLTTFFQRLTKAVEALVGDKPGSYGVRQDLLTYFLNKGLWGIDVDPYATDVTRIMLLVEAKEAKLGKNISLKLLSNTIRTGNSLTDPSLFREVVSQGGFDMVIVNPPYLRIRNMSAEEIQFYKHRYKLSSGFFDLYFLYFEVVFKLLQPEGVAMLVTSNQFLHRPHGKPLLDFLYGEPELEVRWIVDFYRCLIFPNATVYSCVTCFRRTLGLEGRKQPIAYIQVRHDGPVTTNVLKDITTVMHAVRTSQVPSSRGQVEWTFVSPHDRIFQPANIQQKITGIREANQKNLKEICNLRSGLTTGLDGLFIGEALKHLEDDNLCYFRPRGGKGSKLNEIFLIERALLKPILFGKEIHSFRTPTPTHHLLFPYAKVGDKFKLLSTQELKNDYPFAWDFLSQHKELIGSRKWSKLVPYEQRPYFYELPRPRVPLVYSPFGILGAALTNRPKFCLNSGGYFFVGGTAGVVGIIPKEISLQTSKFYLGVLNSEVYGEYLKMTCPPKRSGYFQIGVKQLDIVPIPDIKEVSQREISTMVGLVDQIMGFVDQDGLCPDDVLAELNDLVLSLISLSN